MKRIGTIKYELTLTFWERVTEELRGLGMQNEVNELLTLMLEYEEKLF